MGSGKKELNNTSNLIYFQYMKLVHLLYTINHRRFYMHVLLLTYIHLLRNIFSFIFSSQTALCLTYLSNNQSLRVSETVKRAIAGRLTGLQNSRSCSLPWPGTVSEDWWPSSFGPSRRTSGSWFLIGSDQHADHSPTAFRLFSFL